MESGFTTWKDILDVIVVPVVLGLIALFWANLQAAYRQRVFRRLIRRELEEIAPYPLHRVNQSDWTEHLRKKFIHQKILNEASENRDFILSLPAELVYFVSQLWESKAAKDAGQWKYYLGQLASHDKVKTTKLVSALESWSILLAEYDRGAAN